MKQTKWSDWLTVLRREIETGQELVRRGLHKEANEHFDRAREIAESRFGSPLSLVAMRELQKILNLENRTEASSDTCLKT